ncbi:MAG: hypothetical protein A2W22_05240 [Candidatus Levybacteria bacterium RBG_16_35_11]|nr:MAG: hypothetical protein A2W22_05240 [Candidatus Levybacteria bacterium RBG_16_35_11]
MKIGIDISPLKTGHFLQHRVRGTGFYLEHLKASLQKYYPKNEYNFFTRSEKLPNDLDLIHIPYFEPFFITLPIKKIKTVVTVHDLTPLVFPKQFPSGIKGKVKWQIQKTRLKKADYIITDSQSSKEDIIKFTGISENRISVVYLAAGEEFKKLEVGNWKLKTKNKYDLPDQFGLYVGDVTWNKNLPKIIQAFENLNLPLVLVGKAIKDEEFDMSNPWNRDLLEVRSLVKEGKNIKALGFVPTDDLIFLYNLATVFVMPSFYEGFGLPILEAMSCGCPVITSKEGSLKEIAGDAALFVDPYNQKEIEEAVIRVFNEEKLRKELSEKGLKQAKNFSWENTAKKTIEAYMKALENR